MGLSPNLFMIPYMIIFGEHYLLARVLGVFTIWLIIIALLFILFGCKRYTPFCAVSILLLIPYLGSSATEEYFFEQVTSIRSNGWHSLSFCAPAYGSSSASMKKLQRTTILCRPESELPELQFCQ